MLKLRKFLYQNLPRQMVTYYSYRRRKFLLDMMPTDAVCAEIGVFNGDFSQKIIDVTKPKMLYLIDSWNLDLSSDPSVVKRNQQFYNEKYEKVQKRFQNEIKAGQVFIKRDLSEKVLAGFENDYFDWVYVDGNHQYDFVKKDLELVFQKVKSDGFITGDDYGREESWHEENVTKAVDDFISLGHVKPIKIKNHEFILQVKKSK